MASGLVGMLQNPILRWTRANLESMGKSPNPTLKTASRGGRLLGADPARPCRAVGLTEAIRVHTAGIGRSVHGI
jgi:hypothetical protein